MKQLRRFCLLSLLLTSSIAFAQRIGVGTNALYWATLTPNVNVQLRMSQITSLNLEVAARPNISIKGYGLRFINFSPELRFWLSKNAKARPFVGIAGQSAFYSGQWKDYTHKGSLVGLGATVGFSWILSTHFSVETTVGAGGMYIQDASAPLYPETKVEPTKDKIFTPAPIKLGVNFIYYFR